jgi:hypothetical protein
VRRGGRGNGQGGGGDEGGGELKVTTKCQLSDVTVGDRKEKSMGKADKK